MKLELICVPYALDYAAGKATVADIIAWDLQVAEWAEAYGLDAVFFAEHYTIGHEASPAPDLMIAAASQRTNRVQLGALGHLLPYHNPVALAHRMMWLDHMTGGRYAAGVAPGAFPTDAKLFGTGNNNAEMLEEGIQIVESILMREGPWTINGKYWTADMMDYDEGVHGPHLKPLQRPRPEMLMTGMQANSPTLTTAGRHGFSPVSQVVGAEVLVTHWETYEKAATEAGHEPNRDDWHVVRDFFVAETDEEARAAVVNGSVGRVWREQNLPLFKTLKIASLLGGSAISADDITVEWMVDNFFLVGSPETVAEKIRKLHSDVGGFGHLISPVPDRGSDSEAYRRSLELMGNEVAPLLTGLI